MVFTLTTAQHDELQALRDTFPTTPASGNSLYLIQSAMMLSLMR